MDPIQEDLLRSEIETIQSEGDYILTPMTEEDRKVFKFRDVLYAIGLIRKGKEPTSPESDNPLKDMHYFPVADSRYNSGDVFDVLKDVTIAGNAAEKTGRMGEFEGKLGRSCIELAEFGRTYSISQSVKGTLESMRTRGFDMSYLEGFGDDLLDQFGKAFHQVNPKHVYSSPKINLSKRVL